MCGIAGFLEPAADRSAEALRRIAQAMADMLVHRGPDSDGTWCDESIGIALGFRRLAIVDLSPAGNQPMVSADGRYVIVYNGEIYNHPEIRAELEGTGWSEWRGHSDTEVMLCAFMRWGIEPTLQRLDGMFALAVWDREKRELTFARDRMGEKPLYYGWHQGALLFGSELKALGAHPVWRDDIDQVALALLLENDFIPAPRSIFRGIRKLRPGHLVTIAASPRMPTTLPDETPYWSASAVFETAQSEVFSAGDTAAVQRLDTLLRNSISKRLEADVPVGVFLSGGIDSSVIAAIAQTVANKPVRSFTIGFDDPQFDEAPHAAAIARHLGTDHTELYATESEALAAVRELPHFFDEPFGDISQIPTLLLARLTRSHVTVGLSGDGGDELFCGYSRYQRLIREWPKIQRSPSFIRRGMRAAAEHVPVAALDRSLGWPTAVFGRKRRQGMPGQKLRDILMVRGAADAERLFRHRMTRWRGERPLADPVDRSGANAVLFDTGAGRTVADLAMYVDAQRYLPDDILVKVDRATMASSLESRAPFLDHRLVAFAWSLPLELKIRSHETKWVLRRTLERYVPTALFDRPKTGFDPPLAKWLRGGLRDWAEALIDPTRLDREGTFRTAAIRRRWREHLTGARNWRQELWTVLAFQAWQEEWRAKATPKGHSNGLSESSL